MPKALSQNAIIGNRNLSALSGIDIGNFGVGSTESFINMSWYFILGGIKGENSSAFVVGENIM